MSEQFNLTQVALNPVDGFCVAGGIDADGDEAAFCGQLFAEAVLRDSDGNIIPDGDMTAKSAGASTNAAFSGKVVCGHDGIRAEFTGGLAAIYVPVDEGMDRRAAFPIDVQNVTATYDPEARTLRLAAIPAPVAETPEEPWMDFWAE